MVVVKQIEPTISLRSKQREIFEHDNNSSLTKSSQKFSIKQKSIDTCYSVSNQLKLSILEYNE